MRTEPATIVTFLISRAAIFFSPDERAFRLALVINLGRDDQPDVDEQDRHIKGTYSLMKRT